MLRTYFIVSLTTAALSLFTTVIHAEPDTSGIQLVEDAPHHLYPELARQYLEAARWDGQREDYESLVTHLSTAANYGSGGAHYELARLYIEGVHITRDMNKAALHLNASAGLGFSEGQRVLGRMLIRGDLDMKDIDRGFALLQEATAMSVRAKRELGMLYAGLLPSPKLDVTYGRALLVDALHLGDQEAGHQLAQLDKREGTFADVPPESTNSGDSAESIPASPNASLGFDGYSGYQPSGAASLSHLTGEQVFHYANNQWIALGKASLQQEARIYALFAIAYDLGSDAAGKELVYLDAINQRMKLNSPDWLAETKLDLREELAELRL